MDTTAEQQLSFAEHLAELRKRFVRFMLVMGTATLVAFIFNEPIIQVLQRPLQDRLYYFTPAGGFGFTVQVALILGAIAALPVLFYHVIKFVAPAFTAVRWKHVTGHFAASILLALAGISFAYFVSLPPALRILKSLSPAGVEALIGAEDYAKFVLIYLAGFALLFQLPLIINFIDKIKPLKPKQLNHYQRHAIAGSFIFGAVITPTPDMFNQAIFALPMILLFQVSLGIIVIKHWRRNRRSAPAAAVVEPLQPTVFFPDNWDHQRGEVADPSAAKDTPAEADPAVVYDYRPRVSGFDISHPSPIS